MKRPIFSQEKHRRGFTLVEIVVVLVILAILAAILIPSMTKWIDKANEKKLIVATHACATAAQTLAYEKYAARGNSIQKIELESDEICDLAGISEGSVKDSTVSSTTARLLLLTYELDGNECTYACSSNGGLTYQIGSPTKWERGQTYRVGDIMSSNGFIFSCLAAHTTGTSSRTRDPSVKSNKVSWEVIGYTGEPNPFTTTVRYSVGVVVAYNGGLYSRTDYNLTGAQDPKPEQNSKYWTYIGPAPETTP